MDVMKKLNGSVIISVQAYEDSPMCASDVIARMALAAEKGGAGALRICWGENIKAVKEVCKLPVVGINKVTGGKRMTPDKVYITPSLEAAAEVIEAGCDVLGMDMTPRGRSWGDVEKLVGAIKARFPDIPIMADVSTFDEGVMAEKLGADIVSTALSGYTPQSMRELKINYAKYAAHYLATGEMPEFPPDYEIIRRLRAAIKAPINAEGRFWEKSEVGLARASGADMITIGSAVTAPDAITRRFVHAFKK